MNFHTAVPYLDFPTHIGLLARAEGTIRDNREGQKRRSGTCGRDDIGKLYANYFTHQTPNNNQNRDGPRKAVKTSILQSEYGYHMNGSNRMIGSFLSYIGPLREIVGGNVPWLEGVIFLGWQRLAESMIKDN